MIEHGGFVDRKKHRPDPLKPYSPAWEKRQRIHAHNGLRGGLRLAEVNIDKVLKSPSTTEGAKMLARTTLKALYDLQEECIKRID